MRQRPGVQADVLALLVLGTLLGVGTWQRSGDPFIDWGRELYSAMSVARGLGIPKDVQLLFGSLSPLVNGAIVYLAGEKVAPILVANLVVLAMASTLVWWIAGRVFGRRAAFMATLVWLAVSAYPHLVRVGNYNFLTPYSHGLTHGLTLGLLAIACILEGLRRRTSGWWLLAGVAFGLSLFAKPEAGLVALPTLITGILVGHAIERRHFGRYAVATLTGLVAASGIVTLAARLAGGVSVKEHLSPYRSAVRTLRMDLPYYAGGTFGPSPITTLLSGGTLFLAILLLIQYAERRDLRFPALPESRLTRRWQAMSVAIPVAAVVACAALAPFAWHRLSATLPWICAAALVSGVRALSATADTVDGRGRSHAASKVVLAVFATGWLVKIGFTPRFDHYGFALSAPALLLGTGFLTGDRAIGPNLDTRPMIRRRALGTALALYLALSSVSQSAAFYMKRTAAVGAGANRIILLQPAFDPRTDQFRGLLRELGASSSFRAGSVIVPEGGLFHFLLQEPSAIRVASLMPLEVFLLGSARVADMILRSPPALIVVAEPGLEEWASSGDSVLKPYRELIEVVESSCTHSGQSGEGATPAGGIKIRLFSPCPRIAARGSRDSSAAEASSLPISSDP